MDSMLKEIVKHAQAFVERYSKEGAAILKNCDDCLEFNQLLENLKLFQLENLQLRGNGVQDLFKQAKTSYFNIKEDDSVSIGVFCIAKGAELSPHDHPNMLVLSKLLCGRLQSRSLDLIDRNYQFKLAKSVYLGNDLSRVGTILEAKLESDKVIESGEILQLTPERGNIHSFVALEDTAMLDILLPNYDNVERFCNFYYEIDPLSDFSDSSREDEPINFTSQDTKAENQNSHNSMIRGKERQDLVKLVYALAPSDLDIVLVEYPGDALY